MIDDYNLVSPVDIKMLIIRRFNDKVRGKRPDTLGYDRNHDGKGGHWLEEQMGIPHNSNNAPDLMGYEMKNDTTSKTTFGDWSASYYIFKNCAFQIDRDRFMEIFGHANPARQNRHSWSGSPVPKIGQYNHYGQTLTVDTADNICAIYSHSRDRRHDKAATVPAAMQSENLIIAQWHAEWMRKKIEDKFNKSGWFKCKKNYAGVYNSIVFGGPISYQAWLNGVRSGLIYFDSGMYQGNLRNYSQWRADNKYWDSLITDTH